MTTPRNLELGLGGIYSGEDSSFDTVHDAGLVPAQGSGTTSPRQPATTAMRARHSIDREHRPRGIHLAEMPSFDTVSSSRIYIPYEHEDDAAESSGLGRRENQSIDRDSASIVERASITSYHCRCSADKLKTFGKKPRIAWNASIRRPTKVRILLMRCSVPELARKNGSEA